MQAGSFKGGGRRWRSFWLERRLQISGRGSGFWGTFGEHSYGLESVDPAQMGGLEIDPCQWQVPHPGVMLVPGMDGEGCRER